VPNTVKNKFKGHKANVKCANFVGDSGSKIISGSSDNTCRLWKTDSGECLGVLTGHSSRIWSVSSRTDGHYCASGSGDTTIKVGAIGQSMDTS
jgi:WD40 repeat protein